MGEAGKRPGQQPTLPQDLENRIVLYVKVHAEQGMCRLVQEVWDYAEEEAATAGMKDWRATRHWWRRFKSRHAELAMRMCEDLKVERAVAENPEWVKRWHDKWTEFVNANNITSPSQIYIIDEVGAFLGYGNRFKVVAMKGMKRHTRKRRAKERP